MDDLDALLADLQSSVPAGQPATPAQPQQPQHQPSLGHFQQHQPSPSNAQQHLQSSSVPGYGSLMRPKQSPQFAGDASSASATSPQNNSLPRRVAHSPLPPPPTGHGNLSELDSLLYDLSSARYASGAPPPVGRNGGTVSPATAPSLSDSYQRPSVDSLLDELSGASLPTPAAGPIYAVPNGVPATPSSKQVTITVRETKTERLPQQRVASSATKELDDLMASLSDFKINGSHHQHQTITEYAQPAQQHGVSYSQSLDQQTVGQPAAVPVAMHQHQSVGVLSVGGGGGDQLDSMLGNLQADMSRQGVTTTQKGCCYACDKPIVGQVITALGRTWHPEHFTCNHCAQELGTRNFFERDGHPYCEPDYHNLFSPRCAYCNGAILDKCVTALEKTWHTEHFFCAQCGQQFGEDGFHERDGRPYCRNDYYDMFAPKCNGCNRAIMENYISALNSQWHPDCFVCRDCRQPFQGGSFFDHDGLPYCETHYHAKRGSLCAGCSKPITGRCITAMFKKFHPEHFVCAFCLKQLNKGTFKEQNDKPYCHGCFDKLFG